MTTLLTFGKAIEALKLGKPVARNSMRLANKFVFKQNTSEVPAVSIPQMTSIPTDIKTFIAKSNRPLRFVNQFAIYSPTNTIQGWSPQPDDVIAEDWSVVEFATPTSPTVDDPGNNNTGPIA